MTPTTCDLNLRGSVRVWLSFISTSMAASILLQICFWFGGFWVWGGGRKRDNGCIFIVITVLHPSLCHQFFFFLGLILCNRILLPTKRRRKITWKKNIFVVIFHLILVFYNKIVFLFFYFIFHLIYTREIWFCWLNKGWKKLQ